MCGKSISFQLSGKKTQGQPDPYQKKITKVSRASISAPGNLVVNHTTMFFGWVLVYGLCGLYLVTPQSHCYYCAILFLLMILPDSVWKKVEEIELIEMV